MMVRRLFLTHSKNVSAWSLFQNSCYNKIDFKINEEYPVNKALHKFITFNIGCLAVTNQQNHVVGMFSERDYLNKISAFGINDTTIKVKELCTAPTVIAKPNDSLDQCMKKMLIKDCRHLLVVDEKSECVGLISMKDVIKELMLTKNDIITRLSDVKMGKGGFFGSE
jgi:predicted transcriptional regulator